MDMERQKVPKKIRIRVIDVEKLKRSLKVGDCLSFTPDTVCTVQDRIVIPKESVVITKKLSHLVIVDNPQRPSKELKTLTYKDILLERMGVIAAYE